MRRIHLRKAREQKRWTQEQLAEAAGLPQARISQLETTTTNPSFDTVLAVAEALEVDPRVLKFGPAQERVTL